MAKSDMKILLVDDHDIVLRGMRHLIEDILGEECHVDGAMTAAEALSAAESSATCSRSVFRNSAK